MAARELLHLCHTLTKRIEDEGNGLTSRFRRLLRGLQDDLLSLEERIAELDRKIAKIAKSVSPARRLMEL